MEAHVKSGGPGGSVFDVAMVVDIVLVKELVQFIGS